MKFNPYIVSEIGVNHEGDIKLAKDMIKSAALSGSNAVKLQMYKADKLASQAFSRRYWSKTEEDTESQHALFSKYDHFDEKDYIELAMFANANNVDFIVTPFDDDMINIAAKVSKYIKIASADITNIPHLRKCALTSKPLIISTGASTLEEIDNAFNLILNNGGKIHALMHCVLNYPLEYKNVQMEFMNVLKSKYSDKVLIGYSDHTKPEKGRLLALELAAFMGADIVEKHFTLDNYSKGNDHYHSMTGRMLIDFRINLERFSEMFVTHERNLDIEKDAIKNARRRIFAKEDIKQGETINENKIIPLRADIGIEIAYWDKIVGAVAKCDISKGDYISLGKIEGNCQWEASI